MTRKLLLSITISLFASIPLCAEVSSPKDALTALEDFVKKSDAMELNIKTLGEKNADLVIDNEKLQKEVAQYKKDSSLVKQIEDVNLSSVAVLSETVPDSVLQIASPDNVLQIAAPDNVLQIAAPDTNVTAPAINTAPIDGHISITANLVVATEANVTTASLMDVKVASSFPKPVPIVVPSTAINYNDPIAGYINAPTNLKDAPSEEGKLKFAVYAGYEINAVGEDKGFYRLENGFYVQKSLFTKKNQTLIQLPVLVDLPAPIRVSNVAASSKVNLKKKRSR
jgi:hypothetical protein